MYNSFIFKKHSQQLSRQKASSKGDQRWTQKYRNSVRPLLVEKYSRRINNFITRLEEDKKDFYEFRQQTQSKALELLKEIEKKERYLGDPNIKLRDHNDWSSMLSPTERIEKDNNKRVFQNKFGNSELAYRSIASQSAYRPPDATQFRSREKPKEIHGRNMKFSYRSRSFSQNSREREDVRVKSVASEHRADAVREQDMKRTVSNNSHDEDQKSQAYSVFSMGQHQKTGNDAASSVSNQREVTGTTQGKKGSKVYFKQIVDLQQNSRDPSIKKSLHQILVRFGVSRIKDVKKQAMVETDNLEEDQF